MKKRKLIFEIMDSLFIMILCFGTLLTAMLMKDNSVSLSYTVHAETLLIVVVGLVVYFGFILKNSERDLKAMIEHLY